MTKEKLSLWKFNSKQKGMRINMSKTKVMICGRGLSTLTDSGKYSCGVGFKGGGFNQVNCEYCRHWVYERRLQVTIIYIQQKTNDTN